MWYISNLYVYSHTAIFHAFFITYVRVYIMYIHVLFKILQPYTYRHIHNVHVHLYVCILQILLFTLHRCFRWTEDRLFTVRMTFWKTSKSIRKQWKTPWWKDGWPYEKSWSGDYGLCKPHADCWDGQFKHYECHGRNSSNKIKARAPILLQQNEMHKAHQLVSRQDQLFQNKIKFKALWQTIGCPRRRSYLL